MVKFYTIGCPACKDIKETIAILTINEFGIDSKIFNKKDFKKIPKDLLNKEVMDEQQEEECLEVWVM